MDESTALLGLSIEPIVAIEAQLSTLPSAVAKPGGGIASNPTLLAEKTVKNLFNYLSGFAGGTAVSPEVAVPIGLIVKWYEGFLAKVRNGGIGFLEREE